MHDLLVLSCVFFVILLISALLFFSTIPIRLYRTHFNFLNEDTRRYVRKTRRILILQAISLFIFVDFSALSVGWTFSSVSNYREDLRPLSFIFVGFASLFYAIHEVSIITFSPSINHNDAEYEQYLNIWKVFDHTLGKETQPVHPDTIRRWRNCGGCLALLILGFRLFLILRYIRT